MRIIDVGGDAHRAGEWLADLVNDYLTEPLRALLPTGRSPLPFYWHLRRIAPGDLTVCHLDELLGLAPGDPRSYREYMRRELPAWATLQSPTLLPGPKFNADLAVVGIGRNGHIAGNEPGSTIDSRTRIVTTADTTRADMASDFPDRPVPTQWLTVGVADVLDAQEVVMLALGDKPDAIDGMLHGPIGPWCPASYLRTHPRLTVLR